MATAFNTNSGIHQLPSNCYPPSESDDEDSFVVLNNSLGPDILTDRVHLNTEPISTHVIQASLDSIADTLAQQTIQTSYIEKIEDHHLITDTSHVSLSTEISPDEIQQKVDNLIAENLKLKDTLAQNNIAMKKQVDTITQWQAEVERVQDSHKEKFTDMKKYITTLKAENEQLKDMANKSKTDLALEETTKAAALFLHHEENIRHFELEAAEKKVEELKKALDLLSLERESFGKKLLVKEQELTEALKENDTLSNRLILYKETEMSRLTNTRSEVDILKDEIVELRDTNNNFSNEIQRFQKQHEKLQADLTIREEQLNSVTLSLHNIEQERLQAKQQLMASQMHITELKESNTRKITEKDKEINALQRQLKQAQEHVDENAALRAQLDLYKNDFEMERNQRKELVAEKNRMADDFQQLQRRNNQLHEEIDQMRSGFVPVKKEEARAPPSDSPPLQRHICPICSRRFGSVLLLEDHIDYCLANTNT